MPEGQQLVLAQNQHAFIQDATKGTVQVYAGPYSLGLSPNDKPVVYDNVRDEFVAASSMSAAIKQNPFVAEGHYLVLENPSFKSASDGGNATLNIPNPGSNSPTTLQVGRKINISGPTTFPLWPGQFAKAIPGHHLRSNQYLVVRVYNADQANKTAISKDHKDLATGALLVIKGTEVPFFIPTTGFEVLIENANYVREALTLERLEYCILLAESGEKRFERGPKVVFPEATETFMVKGSSRKFKAIELNDQMGLYIKVIADYEEGTAEDKKTFKAGDELFITGKDQRIYYPRAEHALIGYKDPKGGFDRERYYGIAIPKGEGRYVLVKDLGDVKTEKGPQIFLPDPRNEVIVRRVLDDKTVSMWYPGNDEALAYNETLRNLLGSDDSGSDNYVSDSLVRSASVGLERSMNRGTKGSRTLGAPAGSFEGDKIERGGQFTPPPTLTLNTKYDGVPTISPYVGYAVQVVNKSGDRRVVVGPATILLEYDESLAVLELSTGKPKSTEKLLRDVYLRVDNNIVSDVVKVETRDLVNVDIKLSYRVNFLREHSDKWFSVENYVKYLCDHMRSILKGKVKALGVKEFIETSTVVVRDTILGVKVENARRMRFFPENGMEVYDVEVLGATIADEKISNLLKTAQQTAVQNAISLSSEEQNLANTERRVTLQTKVAELDHELAIRKLDLAANLDEREAEITMATLQSEIEESVARLNSQVAAEVQRTAVADATLNRRKNDENFTLELEEKRVAFFKSKFEAITPDLVQAMMTLGQTEFASKLATALAPLALHEQTGIGTTLERVFKGTALEGILNNLQSKPAKSGS